MMTQTVKYHSPVLLEESIRGLNIRPDGIYIDVTFGGGGHSAEILKHLTTGKLIAFDKDEDCPAKEIHDSRFVFINHDFIYLKNFINYLNIKEVDGILADLGVSSHQFDKAERGFSFRFDSRLDMRMDKESNLTAYDIVNTYPEEKIAEIFYLYGEIRESRKLASQICQARKEKKIETTGQLYQLISRNFPLAQQKKKATLAFQALRMAVNHELEALQILLSTAAKVLVKHGRLVVISYHSLEDRMVKNFFKTGDFKGEELSDPITGEQKQIFRVITPKAIRPSEEEVAFNSRARSAKLRIAEKI